MNNEAKFICCLGGFIGFLSFFPISLLLGEDALSAVLRGSVGCLFCSLCARGILQLVLLSFATTKNLTSEGEVVVPSSGSDQDQLSDTDTEEIAQESDKVATSEAVSEASPSSIESVAA